MNKIEYGNQTTSSNLDLYWSDFSLKISPLEQVTLLKKFNTNEFHLNFQNVFSVKNAIKIASTPNGNFYGKTGTGRVNGQDVNGWFIGYIKLQIIHTFLLPTLVLTAMAGLSDM